MMDNPILEQVNPFIYLGWNISYEEKHDITSKINTFVQILVLLNDVLKPNLVQRQSGLKFHNT